MYMNIVSLVSVNFLFDSSLIDKVDESRFCGLDVYMIWWWRRGGAATGENNTNVEHKLPMAPARREVGYDESACVACCS